MGARENGGIETAPAGPFSATVGVEEAARLPRDRAHAGVPAGGGG